MTNAVALVSGEGTVAINKAGAQGSYALAVAFASRDTRMALGQAMYGHWLANGNFQALANDVIASGLVPKSALPFVEPLIKVNAGERISRERFTVFAMAVVAATESKGKELKGKKSFVYEVLRRVAAKAGN